MLIFHLVYPQGSLLASFGLAAVTSPASVADKAKSDDFDLWPDLDLTYDICNSISKILFKKFQ